MTDFLPVLLGSDANVYGMARSFYGQYGVTSAAVCKGALVATANSSPGIRVRATLLPTHWVKPVKRVSSPNRERLGLPPKTRIFTE